jgi:signal transduction histidine kinase
MLRRLHQSAFATAGDIDNLRLFVSHVISAGDLERARVAHALHESTAQNLSAIVMQLGAITSDPGVDAESRRRLDAVRDLARETLEEVRLLSHTMYPRSLDDLGLAEALRNLASSACEPGLEVRLEVDIPDSPFIPRTVRSVLYWVAQEAVLNASRHANAADVLIRLGAEGRRLVLEVQDNGDGFSVPEAEARRPGMGLFAMRERVALVDGELHIHSDGGGTSIVASVPVDQFE